MAPTAGPTITSVNRHSSDPTILVLTYTVPVSGVTAVQLWEKPSGNTAAPVQIANVTSPLDGNISVKSRYAADVAVELYMTLTHVSEGPSQQGGKVTVPAFEVATPTLVSATRNSATTALLTLSGLTVGFNSRAYVYRSAPGGNPVQVDAFDITVSSGTRNAPAPSGTAEYEFEVRVGQHGILSDPSTRRSVDAWYQTPPAPTSFSATRDPGTGKVSLTWAMPSTTGRNRWLGVRMYRARSGQPPVYIRTYSAAGQTVVDASTLLPTSGYDYGVEAYNEAGASSSMPTASVDAVREAPNAASGLSVTALGSDQWQLAWTTNPTTERPITEQKILGRVPGQTARTVLATLSGNVTSYKLTLPSNRIYELSVLTSNSVGDASATSSWEGPVVSSPPVLRSVSAVWSSASEVQVDWTHIITPSQIVADAVEVELSTAANPDVANDADWLPGTTAGLTAGWVQTGASSAVPHTYRARIRHTASGAVSAWVASSTLAAQAVPMPPTMVMPWTVDATGVIPLTFHANPVDGTGQTDADVRYRLQGTTVWTEQNVGTLTRFDIPANTYTNGGWLEVQGRTSAASGVLSDWGHVTVGASLLVPLRAKPTLTNVTPDDAAYPSQTLTHEWTSTGQARVVLELWDDTDPGNPIFIDSVTVGPEARSHTWDVVLEDGHTYLSEAIVWDAWQQGNMQRLTVTVDYDLPAPPTLTAEQAELASVLLQATPINTLELRRSSDVVRASDWSVLAGAFGASTLTLPDGTVVETTTITGTNAAMTTSEITLTGTYSVTGFTAYCEAGATLTLERYEGASMVASTTRALEARVPTVVRWEQSTGGAASTYRVVVGYPPSDAVHVWAEVAIAAPDPADLADDSYFDASTVREGYVYGWLSEGVAYEAEVASGTPSFPVAVAITERIEIWCSDTGEDGTWRLCGETGTGWDYHDRHPKITTLWYKARSVAASGAWAESAPVQITVRSRDAFVHFGDDFGEVVTAGRLVDALTIDGGGLDLESIQYEGHDGWTHHGTDMPLAESISTDLQLLPAHGASTLADWARALRHETVLYREPGGLSMRGAPAMGPRRPSSRYVQRLSLTIRGEML